MKIYPKIFLTRFSLVLQNKDYSINNVTFFYYKLKKNLLEWREIKKSLSVLVSAVSFVDIAREGERWMEILCEFLFLLVGSSVRGSFMGGNGGRSGANEDDSPLNCEFGWTDVTEG